MDARKITEAEANDAEIQREYYVIRIPSLDPCGYDYAACETMPTICGTSWRFYDFRSST